MTDLPENVVDYLADLCRIACTEEEKKALYKDLKQILGYIDQLNEVATVDIEPCTYVAEALQKAPLRKDVPHNTLSQKEFLKNAPGHTAQMIRVPTVMKQEE